jgi:hypothetical protein
MAKRRVYEPGRDRGWSNGRYWKPKQHEDVEDAVYDAFCGECEKISPHQWDECIVCQVNKNTKERVKVDEDLESFGRDIADH